MTHFLELKLYNMNAKQITLKMEEISDYLCGHSIVGKPMHELYNFIWNSVYH